MRPTRRLYLLRHAKSSWKEPDQVDRERPLSKRGRKACMLIGAHLAEARIRPDAVLCSPAQRTVETLARISLKLPKGTDSWTEERIYGAGSDELLDLLRELPDAYHAVLLIGHNPGLAGLAELLAADGDALPRLRAKYPTGALATLEFPGSWQELRPGAALLDDFARPKDLT